MLLFLTTIGLTALLFIIFKSFDKFGVNAFHAVVVNYFTCILVGLGFSWGIDYSPMLDNVSWVGWSVLMGVLFITTFYMMAWSAINISVSVSTISSKLSLIIPVFVSVFILKTGEWSWLYGCGFLLVLISIVLSVYTPKKSGKIESKRFVFAVLIFLMTGAVDTLSLIHI